MRLVTAVLLLALVWGGASQQVTAAEQGLAAQAPRAAYPRHHALRRGSGLDEQVKLLTGKLDLDGRQQAGLRLLLERERQQLMQIRANPALPAVDRVHEATAIADRTADQIRAMLSEEQLKKYPAARPPRDAGRSPQPDLEHWMQLTRPKDAAPAQ